MIVVGISVLEILLKYHGVKTNSKKLKKNIEVDGHGTYAPQLGSYLMKIGFDVDIVMLHPRLFTLKDTGMGNEAAYDRFTSIMPDLRSDSEKTVIDYFIQYAQDGGSTTVKIPDEQDITNELLQGRPVVADLTTRFLRSVEPWFNLHFNLVTGIDRRFIYVNDPGDGRLGGRKRYLIKDWMFGLHASTYAGFHEGTLMRVRVRATSHGLLV